jgi:hypothetical protein
MRESPMPIAAIGALLSEQAALFAARARTPAAPPNYLDLVALARDLDTLSEQLLKLSVQQCRDAGHTWQELGDLLGVTRQAAFQRFGRPIDPRTGEPMDKTVHMTDAAERARKIVADVLDGRMEEARACFDEKLLEAFTDKVRGDALATVAGLVGAFEGFAEAEPFVRRIGDHTVVDLPLHYEAGDMKARVAFDQQEKAAGFFILLPEAP